ELIRNDEELDSRRVVTKVKNTNKKSIIATNKKSRHSSVANKSGLSDENNVLSEILNTSVSSDDLNSQTKEIEDILIDNEYDYNNNSITNAGSVTSSAVRTVFPIFQHMIEFKVFNDLELNRLLELFTATNIFVTGPLYPWIKTEITDISQLSPYLPNFLINSIKTTIHFAKNLSSCQELYGDDKKYLVKYGYSDVKTMRSLFYYNFEQQYWTVNTHHQTAIIMPLKVFEIRGEYYHRLKAFYDTLDTEWDRDHVVLDL
ncbi:unnamed protein product, partial [Medioppia subpectinata]